MSDCQILGLEHMCLLFVGLGGQDEMLRYHWIFVEDEYVTWIVARQLCYQEIRGWIVEWVRFLLLL